MKTKLKIWILLCFVLTAFTFGQSIEGKITKISGNKIEINLGSLDGIVKDTNIEIYKKSRLLHPVTGEEIRTQKERIGVIRIDDIEYDKSSGTLVTYQKTPVVGDLVEIMLDDYEYVMNDKVLTGRGQVKDAGLNSAIITLGKRDNIEEGLIFDVFRSSQAVNPETGEKIQSKSEKVGRLLVSTVRETDSYCRIVDGSIQIGDEIALAEEQQDDINLERRLYDQPEETAVQVMKDPGIGRIYKIDSGGIHIYFDKLYNFKAGDILAVYRNEKLIHPVTNKFLGEELIKVGEISLTDLTDKEGIAKVISSDADIKVADVVKVLRLAAREPAAAEQPGDTAADDAGMRQQAINLTQEILSIQKEISTLKVMAYKVDQIDRELKEQRRLTTSLQEDVSELKDLIKYGTIERKEPLEGGPEVRLLGETATKENTFTVRYSDDIPLKFQIKNKTLTVGIDVDSSRFTGMEYPEDDSTAAMMMSGAVGGAWYTNWMFWAGATILELLAIGFLVMTIKKKKGKVSAVDEDEEEYDEEEEMEEEEFGEEETEGGEEEEDEFGDEELGEDEEEICEPEEEIEDIEELGEEEEEVLDDEAL